MRASLLVQKTEIRPPSPGAPPGTSLHPWPLIESRRDRNSMKYSLELAAATRPEWTQTVLANFPGFMQDHADCERKASAMALSFVAKYPDRLEIIPELIETAVEEL